MPRKGIQWTVLGLIIIFGIIAKVSSSFSVDVEAYCPFGGLQALGSFLLNDALSCSMTGVQIVMGITLIVAVLLFSKLFCSFICPVGTITEWMSKLGRRLKVQITPKGLADKALRSIKYILLFVTLYYTFQSNELFCKKFDPYYGLASGFDSDVVLLWSLASIAIVFVASIFIRLFWCKYLCPLGAISNIFKFTGFFVVLMAIYLILVKIGLDISYVWPLAAACVGGYLIEITQMHGKAFPLVKVTRNESSCINCSICSHKCPQAIDVASLKVVKDADCNLCGDCVAACPEPNTLHFNKSKKFKYLPHIATVVLVLAGMLLGQFWHIPTINQRWYDFDNYDVHTYERSGLSTVKCYGSSTAFANKMRKLDGVLGVATYVDTKTAKIYYDATKLDEEAIERSIFTPQKIVLRQLNAQEEGVQKVHVSLEDFFDKNDFNYLARFLQDHTTAVGILSEYACPVIVEVFFPASEKLSEEELVELFETKAFSYTYKDKEYTAEMGYEVIDGPEISKISSKDYAQMMFIPVDYQFNNKSEYSTEVIKSYIVPSPINNQNRSRLKYLISHLSNDDGVVAFRNYLDSTMNEAISISYVDTMTSIENINQSLTSDTLYFNYSDGRIGKTVNLFDFILE